MTAPGSLARHNGICDDCRLDLEADATRVWCWKCGWEVRDVDNGPLYTEIRQAIR